MEIELEVRRTRRSRPNPGISSSIDTETTFKLNNGAHLRGSPTVKLGIDIKQSGADIEVISGEREVTPVREGADHVRRCSDDFKIPGGVVIKAKLHEESESGEGGSHEKTVEERKAGTEDAQVSTVEAAGHKIIERAPPEQEPAPCWPQRWIPEVHCKPAPPMDAVKSNLCEQCQHSGAKESIIHGAKAEKNNAHDENRRVETPREAAAQLAQLKVNIMGNAAPAETSKTKLPHSLSLLAGSAALISVLSLAIHFIPPKRR